MLVYIKHYAVLAAIVLIGCARTKRSPPGAVDASEGTAVAAPKAPYGSADLAAPDVSATGAASLPPLGGEWIERWTMPSGATVFVTRPLGATGPRPIVLGVHGAEDRADWACSEWHGATAGFAWVLCPQGVALRSAYAWSSPDAIATLAFEARDVLRSRSGSYVAPGPVLYGGFSQGASLASSVVAAHPGDFGPVVMVEAGHTPLSASGVVFGLKKGRVDRALLSCSTGGCSAFSSELVLASKRSSFELLTNDAGRRGHVFDGVVIKSLGETMINLVAGDPRYDGFAKAISSR